MMSRRRILLAQIAGLFHHKRTERQLADEIRFHLEMQEEENRRKGMSPYEARYAARRNFGPVEAMKESYRTQSTVAAIETTLRDIRFAARSLCKNPGFAVTSILILTLAVGANTAMFSVLETALLRPLPFPSPAELMMLWTERPSQSLREGRSAYWNVEEWRSQNVSFTDLAVFDPASGTLDSGNDAERIKINRVSPNFFRLIGVAPMIGRLLSDVDVNERQHVGLISFAFWKRQFAGSRHVIGTVIRVDGEDLQVAGVLPESFEFPKLEVDVWEPYTLAPDWQVMRRARGAGSWFVVGRLRANISVEQAQAEINTIARRLDEQMPASERGLGVTVVPLRDQIAGPNVRLAIWMLTAAVVCVLLIAITNTVSLSLARSVHRQREITTRLALGASNARIVRQMLAESMTLTLTSGMLGVGVAYAVMRVILALMPDSLGRSMKASPDLSILGFTLAISLVAGMLVGLTPAVALWGARSRFTGREGDRTSTGGIIIRRTRRVLVVGEYAAAVVLLASTGLLVRSLWSLEQVELGFRPEHVLSAQIALPALMPLGRRPNVYNRLLDEVQALPGVQNAAIIENFLFAGSFEQTVVTEGITGPASVEHVRFRSDAVSDAFFRTLQTPLISGRFFSDTDTPASSHVAILNEAMARRLWRDRNPVGQRFRLSTADVSGPWLTVTGVVGNMRRLGLESASVPQMFTPLGQSPPRLATLLIRTAGSDSSGLAAPVKEAVHRVEKLAPVYAVSTLEDQLASSLIGRRFQTSLLIAFSLIALVTAAIGLYGLIQYSVSTRTKEIGIRMALGARTTEIRSLFLLEGLHLSLTGLLLGLGGALLLARAASRLLYGISASDPATFIVVLLMLTAVAGAACYFPARRAMGVEPIQALRHD